ncbi:MAG: histidine--tRNA ligase [Oscillospiraceae bacterium]|jgi:histidyl-tRNA synthetase|nr:histidine--tRNA ligase [Oscillospiraceae bacterium]
MKPIIKAAKGTRDILPEESCKWQFLENLLSSEAAIFGFSQIRTPVFEHTELFLRSVGETSDVVQKEMYTFTDKGGRSITLRPEGTAGKVRALIEHALYNRGFPIKLYYFDSCYRYEKPQAGRFREFYQFGAEIYGSASPIADAELIYMLCSIFSRLRIERLSLEINSIGCQECRSEYHKALYDYFDKQKMHLCDTCLNRLERNPMRILDCKNPNCNGLIENAPIILNFICKPCEDHFKQVKNYLEIANIAYTVNPKIVRGLDYYTRTVFEFKFEDMCSKNTVCGGGRYDKLLEELGTAPTPALGFGMGIERLLMLLENQGIKLPSLEACDLYIATIGENSRILALNLAKIAREASIKTEYDLVERSLKAQMKYADKIGAKLVLVLGDEELEKKQASLKNMKTGELSPIHLDDEFFVDLLKIQTKI